MTDTNQKKLGSTLWGIADQLRGAMDADDFRDYVLSFLFLRYLSDNYETAAKKELGKDYPKLGTDDRRVPLSLWYANNPDDLPAFEKQMRRKVHYVSREQLVRQAVTAAQQNSDDLPASIGSAAAVADVASLDKYRPLFARVEALAEGCNDTEMSIGIDLMNFSLRVYGQLKLSASDSLNRERKMETTDCTEYTDFQGVVWNRNLTLWMR